MNSIVARPGRSKYVRGEHLVLCVDECPLDVMLAQRLPASLCLEGLVPVLACPDDGDLSCTVVVAEVHATETAISWLRLGLDRTPWDLRSHPQCGGIVEWFSGIGPFEFSRSERETCVERFRAAWPGETG